MSTIKFIIADDHKIFRDGLKFALGDETGIECVGEAPDGLQLMSLLQIKEADVLILDLNMPLMDGIAVTKAIRKENDRIKIIILTMFDDEAHVIEALEAGANGYLLKNADEEEIKDAISTVHTQDYYFNKTLSFSMLHRIKGAWPATSKPSPGDILSQKEQEVLKLICQELTAAEIAKQMYLSVRTVEGIKRTLLEKLGVKNTAGLVVYALRNGVYE